MTAETQAESAAHDTLRDAIRQATLAQWDRRIAADMDDTGVLADTRSEVEAGILVDYVIVAMYDSGQDHTVSAVLRTDGECAQYRTVGLLQQALHDVL